MGPLSTIPHTYRTRIFARLGRVQVAKGKGIDKKGFSIIYGGEGVAHTRYGEGSKLGRKTREQKESTGMLGEAGWTIGLNLEEFKGVQAEVFYKLRQMRLIVVPRRCVAVCPNCGQMSTLMHQTPELDGIHDLPLADWVMRLVVRVPQFWCGPCARVFRTTKQNPYG